MGNHSQNIIIMAQEMIKQDELQTMQRVFERLNIASTMDSGGDWLDNVQITDFSNLIQALPQMAVKCNNDDLVKDISYLTGLLYTIAKHQEDIRNIAQLLYELERVCEK